MPPATSRLLQAHDHAVRALAFDSASNRWATGDAELNVAIWHGYDLLARRNLRSGEAKARTTAILRQLRFLAGGSLLAAAGERLLVLSPDDLSIRWEFVPPRLLGFLVASPVAILPKEDGFAASFNSGWMGVWDGDRQLRAQWRANDAPTQIERLDEARAIGFDGFSLTIWDLDRGERVASWKAADRVNAIATGREIVVARSLPYVQLFDARTGAEHARYETPVGLPLIALSPDGRRLAIGGSESVDWVEGGARRPGRRRDARLTSLAFAPDGRLASGWNDGTVDVE